MDPMFIDVGKFAFRDLNSLKQNMTLDLFSMEANQAKLAENPSPSILSSPDLMMLKVVSPEMEKMYIDQQIMVTSPSAAQMYFSRNPTEEQESYASGFVGTLQELHSSGYSNFDQQDTTSSYESLDSRFPAMDNFRMSPDERVVVKDEPATVPDINSPPMSPIDMESQERIKLERKRLNNRLAAAKCRKRKLERIGLLEEKVKVLKGENAELTQVVNRLMDQVYHLKQQVIEHAKSGCPISLALTND